MKYGVLFLLAVVAVVLCIVLAGCDGRDPALKVYTAAGLTYPITEISGLFTADTKVPVEHCFANAAVLRRKIEQAAGRSDIGVYISANRYHMEALSSSGMVDEDTVTTILSSTLVAIVPAANREAPAVPEELLDLEKGFVAMGDPDARVPCGMYAREALQNLGLWARLKERSTREATVCAVLRRVEEDMCPVGIVFAAEAHTSSRVRIAFEFPAETHRPISFLAGAVTGYTQPEQARAYLDFLQTPAAGKVFSRYGFVPSAKP